MACANLKRSLDCGFSNPRPSKRRRLDPFGQSTSDSSMSQMSPSNAADVSMKLSLNAASNSVANLSDNTSSSWNARSAFTDANISKISIGKMAQNLCDEIRRLEKPKYLSVSVASSFNLERMQDSESSSFEIDPNIPSSMMRNPEGILYTFKQVQMICGRILREREVELREKYDAVLTERLAEQYDEFVKFTYDEIQKRYKAAPSYLS